MIPNICLDAGVITLYYQKDPPDAILALMDTVKQKTATTFVPAEILVEAFKHLCVSNGKDYATRAIQSFYQTMPIDVVVPSLEIILQAGQLKCQHRSKLSYNDCVAIAIAQQERATLHTTEKEFPPLKGLKVKTYEF
ncbi:MAG TPA: PIN domain-containing protein [Candidatus Lokiarchaeia archaeon]|nr:PIN domain-containing protein [Candidatus Lokiarchaeia archaeon]